MNDDELINEIADEEQFEDDEIMSPIKSFNDARLQ